MNYTSQVLYDGRDIQVIYLPGDSDFTLLTFDVMHARANGRSAFGRALAQKAGLELVAVVPKFPCWYPAEELQQAAEIIRKRAKPMTLAYGASMGGYGALRWGKAMGASRALACSPQISIDPARVAPQDKRYQRHFDPLRHIDMDITQDHLPEYSVVLHDRRFTVDAFHADALAEFAGVEAVHLPHTDHKTAACLTGTDNALTALNAAIDMDAGTIRRLALARRKRLPNYHLSLAETARRLGHAERVAGLAAPARDIEPVSFHLFMAKIAAIGARQAEAVRHYRAALAINPKNPMAIKRLEMLMVSGQA